MRCPVAQQGRRNNLKSHGIRGLPLQTIVFILDDISFLFLCRSEKEQG